MKSLLFTDPMVRAILEGRKTMTRRIVKPQPHMEGKWLCWQPKPTKARSPWYCEGNTNWKPIAEGMMDYGAPIQPGETFYVREAWRLQWGRSGDEQWGMEFRASTKLDFVATAPRWRSPLHLREADARLFLRCTDVRVERVQDIREEDAKREGVTSFQTLWESIHGEESWHANPWVWVYQFEKIPNPNPTKE